MGMANTVFHSVHLLCSVTLCCRFRNTSEAVSHAVLRELCDNTGQPLRVLTEEHLRWCIQVSRSFSDSDLLFVVFSLHGCILDSVTFFSELTILWDSAS